MVNNRIFYSFNNDVHKAAYAKHLRKKEHLEKDKQNETIIPGWLFQEPIGNKL